MHSNCITRQGRACKQGQLGREHASSGAADLENVAEDNRPPCDPQEGKLSLAALLEGSSHAAGVHKSSSNEPGRAHKAAEPP
jgi:hypothetical protein